MLIREVGLLNKWTNDYTPNLHQCVHGGNNVHKTIEEGTALTIQQLFGAFALLIIGLFVSLVVFIVENLIYKISRIIIGQMAIEI